MATEEQIRTVTAEFIRSTPEFAAYLTSENCQTLAAYVDGAFPDAVLSVSAWQIAFKAQKKSLKRISGYQEPITDAQRSLVRDTPCYQHRDRYKSDEAYRTAFDLIAAEEAELKKNPWLRITAEQYQNFDPTWAARNYVDDENFKKMVDGLIARGEI